MHERYRKSHTKAIMCTPATHHQHCSGERNGVARLKTSDVQYIKRYQFFNNFFDIDIVTNFNIFYRSHQYLSYCQYSDLVFDILSNILV